MSQLPISPAKANDLHKAAKALLDRWGKGNLSETAQALQRAVDAIQEDVKTAAEHDSTVEAARNNYAEDQDISVDNNPAVAPADDGTGCWVAAWIWVGFHE